MGAQKANLKRVSDTIAPLVIDFCIEHQGKEFHAGDLKQYVIERAMVAPASPDRILRDLRKKGIIEYEVVSRSRSLYRIPE